MSTIISKSVEATSHPTSYATGYQAYSVSSLENAYTDSSSTTYATIYLTRGTSATTSIIYNFNFNIPSDATIQSVACTAKCSINNTNSTRVATRQIQLQTLNSNGYVAMGSASTVANSTSIITMTPGTWTAKQVNNAKIRLYAVRGTSSNYANTSYYFRFYGATMTVTYTYDETVYVVTSSSSYSETSVSPATQNVEPGESADVNIRGVVEGITVTDNDTDVTSSLVQHQYTNPSYSVNSISGATYGFALSNNWYESQNKGVSNSAALCRVNINTPVSCRVIITYINYAEATYDFGIFSKLDTALTLNYPVSSSNGGDTSIDNGLYEKRCNASSDNTSSEQTLIYTISEGEHFIDIKFGKDSATNSNNDSLKFKIELTPLETVPTGYYYTYTINNVQDDHTILVSAGSPQNKIFIKLPAGETLVGTASNSDRDNYILATISYGTIVPGDNVRVALNNITKWSSGASTSLGSSEVFFTHAYGTNRYFYAVGNSGVGIVTNQYSPSGNYTYDLTIRIQYNGDASDSYTGSIQIYKQTGGGGWTKATNVYIKVNGSWTNISKAYKKENNTWTEEDKSVIFDQSSIFISGL